MRLRGKTALITGGSQGIGEAIALRFGAEGAEVGVVASSRIDKAKAIVDKIKAAGGKAHPFVADVSKVASINALAKEAEKTLGRIDILVNSAGVFFTTPVGSTSEEDFDRTFDINVKGTFFCINAIAPGMKARKSGIIINFSSTAGIMGMNPFSVYCGSKGAIITMTKALACELAPHGIRVNCIAPGNTATPMNINIRTEPQFKALLDYMAGRTPSGRTYSEADDMAKAAVYLASDDSRAMHGATMVLDEGMSAGL
ncbi:MAG: SDR family oxidoreductase [Alphaproteobacteria bacterium]|nr:SDR family oxidoreductase [Alphaproteobacteria bacterium]